MTSKIDAIFVFLSEYGKVYIENYDITTLNQFTKTVLKDDDIAAVTFTSATGEILSTSGKVAAGTEVISEMHDIKNAEGKVLGKVDLQLKTHRMQSSIRETVIFSVLANLVIQMILFLAVYFVSNRVIKIESEKSELGRKLDIQSALAFESQKVAILVDNMRQAVFSIDSQRCVVEPVSQFSKKAFGIDILGAEVVDFLFKSVESNELKARITSALNIAFGEDEIQWQMVNDEIPRKIQYLRLAGLEGADEMRTMRIQLSPIWNAEKKLERILFVVEDTTNQEKLEQELGQQRLQTKMTEELLGSVDPQRVVNFIERCEQDVKDCIKSMIGLNPETFRSILRTIHTLKGNSGYSNLRCLSETLHNVETAVAIFGTATELDSMAGLVITEELTKVKTLLEGYRVVHQRIFSAIKYQEVAPAIPQLAHERLSAAVVAIADKIPRSDFEVLESCIQSLQFSSLKKTCLEFSGLVQNMAAQLGKKVELIVEGDALFPAPVAIQIQDCLVHLVRNSLDHGLETPSERQTMGKNEVGRITISLSQDSSGFQLVLRDDGRGLDAQKIQKRAIEKGIVSGTDTKNWDEEKVFSLVFTANFSTMDAVTEFSGRGVGLDVVKSNVEALGGGLAVASRAGQGTQFTLSFHAAKLSATKDLIAKGA